MVPESTQPNAAELQLYPHATMSEKAANALLAPSRVQRTIGTAKLDAAMDWNAENEARRQPIDKYKLSAEWLKTTGDSYIVDCQPFYNAEAALSATDPIEAAQLIAADLVEVLKYPMKFGSMTQADTWHAFCVSSGQRLASSFGCLWGVQVDPSYLDDPITAEDWPYVEVIARWMFGGYVVERADDWTHNDDADAYMRDRYIARPSVGFSEAKSGAASGDDIELMPAGQASPHAGGVA